jgi:hypothetical protein
MTENLRVEETLVPFTEGGTGGVYPPVDVVLKQTTDRKSVV